MSEVELFATRLKEEGLDGWRGNGIQRLGSVGDGKLLTLYVNAKTKAEELEKAHKEFLTYMQESRKG